MYVYIVYTSFSCMSRLAGAWLRLQWQNMDLLQQFTWETATIHLETNKLNVVKRREGNHTTNFRFFLRDIFGCDTQSAVGKSGSYHMLHNAMPPSFSSASAGQIPSRIPFGKARETISDLRRESQKLCDFFHQSFSSICSSSLSSSSSPSSSSSSSTSSKPDFHGLVRLPSFLKSLLANLTELVAAQTDLCHRLVDFDCLRQCHRTCNSAMANPAPKTFPVPLEREPRKSQELLWQKTIFFDHKRIYFGGIDSEQNWDIVDS